MNYLLYLLDGLYLFFRSENKGICSICVLFIGLRLLAKQVQTAVQTIGSEILRLRLRLRLRD